MPRYTPSNCMGRNVDVYLDGVLQADVFEADDDLGFIIRAVRGEDGKLVIEGAYVKREIKQGNVRVAFPAPQPVQ
ncbi:MAG: hypothetical protein EpisKO_06480 [Epibacterium sp.]